MAFAAEFDDLQPEIEQGETQTLTFWPKVDGANVAASSTLADNTVQIFDPNNTSIVAVANIARTQVGSISKFVVSVAAPPTATFLKREGYEARFRWRVTGETEIRTDEVEFAVVARRWPDALSLNDLQSRCYYVGEFCQTAADARSESTAEDAAKSFIYEAKRNLDAKLRNRSWQDGQLRPTLVYDQRLLRQTWTLEAIAVVLLSASKSATDQDGTFSLYQEFRRLADEAWNNLGEIRYDADDSGLPDTKVRPGVRFWSR